MKTEAIPATNNAGLKARLAAWWARYLGQPIDGASLAAFRVMFGLIMAWEVVRYFENGWIERYYIQPTFFFTYPLFGWLSPWPGNGMYVHFAALGVLALCIALGAFYRAAAALFWLGFTYVFLLDKANYLNHFYLVSLFSFLLISVPAHRVASLDRRWFFPHAPPAVPRWSLLLLRAQMFIVYFYAGLAKLNPDWLAGEPMRMWLAERSDFPLLGRFFTDEWLVYTFAYGAAAFDLSIGFLLLWKPTRPAGLALAAFFHGMNSQLFNLGIFPALAMAATLLFLDPSWPRPALARLRQAWAALRGQPGPAAAPARPSLPAAGWPVSVPVGRALWVFFHVYLLTQLVVPLRHWLYPGEVSWTEEGHRFAWHMLLRDKRADLRLYVTHPRTGESRLVDPYEDLTDRQVREMRTRPDMVLQYAHYLADRLSAEGQPRPIVAADLQVSLNGRPYQTLIDLRVDLASVRAGLGPAGWITGLETPLEAESARGN